MLYRKCLNSICKNFGVKRETIVSTVRSKIYYTIYDSLIRSQIVQCCLHNPMLNFNVKCRITLLNILLVWTLLNECLDAISLMRSGSHLTNTDNDDWYLKWSWIVDRLTLAHRFHVIFYSGYIFYFINFCFQNFKFLIIFGWWWRILLVLTL